MKIRKVYQTGDVKRMRSNDTTGRMSFKQRQELADFMGRMHPIDAKVPAHVNKAPKHVYTPIVDKFDGYTHYPRPVCKPYANHIDFHSHLNTKEYLQKQRKSLQMVVPKPEPVAPQQKLNEVKKPGIGAHKRSVSLHHSKYKGLTAHQHLQGYFLYESLKDPEKESVNKIKGDVLSGRFNDVVNGLSARKNTTTEMAKPLFGYFPKPGR